MSKISKENRRESYESILKDLGRRHEQVLTGVIEMGGMATANELARHLLNNGVIPFYNTNYTNPRMIELVEQGVLEVIGKRKDEVTNRNVSIYKIKSIDNNKE